MNLIGIDPGCNGGIAIRYNGLVNATAAHKMPETEGDVLAMLRQLCHDSANTVAFVEQVGGFIGKGTPGSAMFNFGRGVGFLHGVLQALGVRIETVTPAKWQKYHGIGTKGDSTTKEWKNKLKSKAQQLYPEIKMTLAISDALLILDYGLSVKGVEK